MLVLKHSVYGVRDIGANEPLRPQRSKTTGELLDEHFAPQAGKLADHYSSVARLALAFGMESLACQSGSAAAHWAKIARARCAQTVAYVPPSPKVEEPDVTSFELL